MAKQTKWWYVIVCTGEGVKFVTDVHNSKRTAIWDGTKPPCEMSESMAHNLALGLTWNGYNAYPVCMKYTLGTQPYDYREGHFEWVWKRENK